MPRRAKDSVLVFMHGILLHMRDFLLPIDLHFIGSAELG